MSKKPPPRKGFGSLKSIFSANLCERAIREMAAGHLDEAYRSAIESMKGEQPAELASQLSEIFYANGKARAARGDFRGALIDFQTATRVQPASRLLADRARATAAAIQNLHHRQVRGSEGTMLQLHDAVEIRRHDVILFANEVAGAVNYETAAISETPILDYLTTKRMLREAIGPLWVQLDSFEAVGVYRWRGDPQSSDEFTGWIRRFKNGHPELDEHLGAAMYEWVRNRTSLLERTDVIIPVPGDPERISKRGYNPPSLLAKVLTRRLGVPIEERILTKRGAPRASTLPYAEVDSNFMARAEHSENIKGRSVLLVDDVATRGYTLAACSQRLKTIGASRVDTLVLAQSITSHRERIARMLSHD